MNQADDLALTVAGHSLDVGRAEAAAFALFVFDPERGPVEVRLRAA